jgi:hypothetical protein
MGRERFKDGRTDSLFGTCLYEQVLPKDHSTSTAFKTRLAENGKPEAFEKVLVQIIGIAQEEGGRFGSLRLVGSVQTVANVSVTKDNRW